MATIGLLLACLGSVFNVLTDVSRKKGLHHQFEATVIGFWCKVVAFVCYGIALGILVLCGGSVELPPMGEALHISTGKSFALYLIGGAGKMVLEQSGRCRIRRRRLREVTARLSCAGRISAFFLAQRGKLLRVCQARRQWRVWMKPWRTTQERRRLKTSRNPLPIVMPHPFGNVVKYG